MNTIASGLKHLLNGPVHLLNQPTVKEGVKNLAGVMTFTFGLIEGYDLYRTHRLTTADTHTSSVTPPSWMDTAHKITLFCAKTSLLLSAAVSRPGALIISSAVGSLCSTEQLERLCGPNTTFAVNPYHPRHLVSLAAFILGLPAAVHATYEGLHWIKAQIYPPLLISPAATTHDTWLTASKVRCMAWLNTITSRPTLHMGNQLSRLILGR